MATIGYIDIQRSASKYTITACRAKVKFKVSVWIVLIGTLGVNISS